jgi:uncharacterized protein YfbU (UPF0304 family)
MLFHANTNRKISASLFDEMFDMEVENTINLSNFQEIIKEPEKVKIETTNKTIEALLEEIQQKEQEVFEMYSLAHTNYSFRKYQQTLYYKKMQAIRTQIKEVAIWLFDNQVNAMPFELKKHFI